MKTAKSLAFSPGFSCLGLVGVIGELALHPGSGQRVEGKRTAQGKGAFEWFKKTDFINPRDPTTEAEKV